MGYEDGVLWIACSQQAALDREADRQLANLMARTASRRQPCGAKTRKGHPCRMTSEPGKRRCKFHGGMSTGPKTPEGRERIAAAQLENLEGHAQ